MQTHIKNYFKGAKLDYCDIIFCEICNAQSVDIHHIIPRSKFGSKRKAEQDDYSNLIALCRSCHEKAHNEIYTKEFLLSKKSI